MKDQLIIQNEELPENHYVIHDNGGRPFIVHVVSPTYVKIYKQEETDDYDAEEVCYDFLMQFENLSNIFIADDDEYTGNNILLETGINEYVLVSCYITRFHSKSKIVKFSSIVGNNDVPYPYAIDCMNRYYILWSRVLLESIPDHGKNDPTMYWVDNCRTQDAMKIGDTLGEDNMWYFCVNVSPEDDYQEWETSIRRGNEQKEENRINDKIDNEILRRLHNNELRPPTEQDRMGIIGSKYPKDFMMASSEYSEIEHMYNLELKNEDFEPEDMFVKIDGEWKKINFEEYKKIQNEWRARLGCSYIEFEILEKRFW